MCGISGIISAENQKEEALALVSAMLTSLAHRGPDGQGVFQTDRVTLGHRRLAVFDPNGGVQPMSSSDGRFVIVFNGAVYNYLELRQTLLKDGFQFRTNSDTEVLLNLLILKGTKALDDINGMFAFFFLDCATGRWISARDPLGIKPFYYSWVGNSFVFASEIKAILKHPGISAQVNWKGLQQYLTFQFCIAPETLFQNIQELKPGHYLEGSIGSKSDKTTCYWDVDFSVQPEKFDASLVEQIEGLLTNALRLQTRSDVPVGTYLAGGLDSSIVTSIAARFLPKPLFNFHGSFPGSGTDFDESSFASIVSQSIGGQLMETHPSEQDFVDHLPHLIYMMDQPAAGPGMFPQYLVSKDASRNVKVVLGGQGGDELFGGYVRYLIGYLEQALKGAIFESQEEGNFVVSFSSILPQLPSLQKYVPLLQHFWSDGLFGPMDDRYFWLIDRSPEIMGAIQQDYQVHFSAEELKADFKRVFNHPDTKSYINKMTHFDLKTFLPALLHVEDRMSMAAGIESRVPLLDINLVNFVTRVPPTLKLRNGELKFLLKETGRRILPSAIVDRKDKMGFPVPLNQWLKRGIVRDFVFDNLLSSSSKCHQIMEQSVIKDWISDEKPFSRRVWGLLCFELWLKAFKPSL